jgi:arylsulfatase A-like enzyme
MAGRRKEETRLARQRRGLATSKPCHPTVKTHGRSLAPLLHGQRANDWRDEVYASYDGDGVSFYTERVVRTRRAKLVYHAYGEHELYDLAADPLEMRNRFNDPARAHLKADLARQLWEWLKRVEDPVARAVGRDLRVK